MADEKILKDKGLKDELLSEEELDNVAGGQLILHLANTAALANENDPSKKLVVGSVVYSDSLR